MIPSIRQNGLRPIRRVLQLPRRRLTPSTPARSMTPLNPAIESLHGDINSRPQTPTVIDLDKDERKEYLKRENELSNQLAKKESALVASEKQLKETQGAIAHSFKCECLIEL